MHAAQIFQRAHAQAAAAGRHAIMASRRNKAEDLHSHSRDRAGTNQAPRCGRAGDLHTSSRDRAGGHHQRQAGIKAPTDATSSTTS
eukprot:6083710-Pyramimonas_sp.AAC.1